MINEVALEVWPRDESCRWTDLGSVMGATASDCTHLLGLPSTSLSDGLHKRQTGALTDIISNQQVAW